MSDNPYTPPSAPVDSREMGRIGPTWKAVLMGVATDLLGTTLAGIVLVVFFSGMLVAQGHQPEQIGSRLMESSAYQIVSLMVGLAFTVLGGYVAARVANHREYWHALIVGAIVLVIGEVVISSDPTGMKLSLRIIGDLMVIPAALMGGHLYRVARLQSRARLH